MKHFVSAFAFLAVICCLTSAAPRPQPGLDSLLGLVGGGGGGLGGLLGGAGGGGLPLDALAILSGLPGIGGVGGIGGLGGLAGLGGLGAPTGPTNVQSSGGDTTLKGVGNKVTTVVDANGNANIPVLNNVLGGGY